jgi:hypothetical protein
MAAHFLTTTSSMSCPHGGTVTPATSNSRVKADGQFVLRSTDTFTVGGCPYTIANTPHPCVRVRWDTHAERHESQGDPSLTRDSVGLCLDGAGGTQGTVVVSSTQSRGSGS